MQGLGNDNYNPSLKPRTLVCYICGREYGSKSLPIHLKNCEQRFLQEEAKKPKKQRRPLPQKPQVLGQHMSQQDIDQYNQDAFDTYNTDALEQCQNCGRTQGFKPESLVVHQRVCKPDKPFKKLPGFVPNQKTQQKQQSKGATDTYKYEEQQQPVRPKTLVCYVCGREYGTKSLAIHLRQCKEMFVVQENKKPKNERRKLPSTPRGLEELLSKDNITLEDIMAYNNGAFNKYNVEALVPCEGCGRTFKPEALAHHMKACNPDKPFGSSSLVPCEKCGRKFAEDRIQKHQAVCKDVKVAQPVLDKNKGSLPTINEPKKEASKTMQNFMKHVEKNHSNHSSDQHQQQQQMAQSVAVSNEMTIRCYICKSDLPISKAKQHESICIKKNNFQGKAPVLFNDLVQISNPSEYLIELYNKQVGPASSTLKVMKTDDSSLKLPPPSPNQSHRKLLLTPDKTSNYRKKFVPNLSADPIRIEQQQQEKKDFEPKQFEAKQFHSAEQEEEEEEEEEIKLETGKFNQAVSDDYEDQQDLVACGRCGRKFTSDRVTKHQKVCKGPSEPKKQISKTPQPTKKKEAGTPKWKRQHDEFVEMVKYNKKIQEIQEKGGDIRSMPPPPKSRNDDYEECPYCGRRFAPDTAARHIPICKNVMNKPKMLRKNDCYLNIGIESKPQQRSSNEFLIRTPQKTDQKKTKTSSVMSVQVTAKKTQGSNQNNQNIFNKQRKY